MISFFAWVEDIALKDDYYLQLRTATRRSKAAVGFIDYDTVATWKSVVDLRHAELEAATKATAEATGEPGAALGAAGADDGAAALARPNNGSGIDVAAADDTAARREANRTAEANACIIIELESTAELRSKLLSSTAGRVIGQHGAVMCPSEVNRHPSPRAVFGQVLETRVGPRRPAGQVRSSTTASRRARPRRPHACAPHLCSC